MNNTLLADRVRAAVERLGFNQFLELSGVSRTQLFAIMREEPGSGGGMTLQRLADAGIEIDGLFVRKPPTKKRRAA